MILTLKKCSRFNRWSFYFFKLLFMKWDFNKHGLRYSASVLEAIKPQLWKLPIEWLATFADAVCCSSVQATIDNGTPLILISINSIPEYMFYNHVNATTIGNMAYIALFHPDENIKRKAYKVLDECFKHHEKSVNLSVNE